MKARLMLLGVTAALLLAAVGGAAKYGFSDNGGW